MWYTYETVDYATNMVYIMIMFCSDGYESVNDRDLVVHNSLAVFTQPTRLASVHYA